MNSMRGVKIGLIGAGAIGGAVIDRLLSGAGSEAKDIVACEIKDARRDEIAHRFGVRTSSDPADAAQADLVILAVPPLEMGKVIAVIRDRLQHRPAIVSFAAGMPVSLIESLLPPAMPVVRINPNSPSLVGAGFNPVTYGSQLTSEARALANRFLAALGQAVEVDDSAMNIYTALTAVGPTYFLPVLDAMINAGLEAGLTREAAVEAAAATAEGTAAMAKARTENPEQLKLYTGLRPLKDAEVRELVRQAIADAAARMSALQQKIADSTRGA
jgi:pyrroline-5-carboxylate reductase